eukprot:NODE_6439_length_510_cov_75.422993_g5663_i0.p1 GENE.NODE_6439_length_510_cov_75.422993_g5663_i0~~NODE_6439_length_510_cov_75.422993_g5663_i0.p1  ORF type:complete len:142 (-),score=28.76 NODE_6439_length_510_cov_75.422993_g5663_i0:39-464(-)
MPKKVAKKAANAVAKGTHSQRKHKVWKKVTFRRPTTLALTRKPKYQRKSVLPQSTWDKFAIIKNPSSTESAIKNIEENNTLVFIVDRKAKKASIKRAVQDLYGVKVTKVNTLIRPTGEKKAYVAISKETEALEIANKIGIM